MSSFRVVSSWSALASSAAAAALLIAACSDSHGHASRTGPDESTETGNPPVIDVARIALVASGDEVHAVGEPGAVSPGGGEVVVESVLGDDVQRGPVEDDGAFDVMVNNGLYQIYVLHVEGAGDAGVSEPVYLNRGGAVAASADGGELSCEERQEDIIAELTQAEADASRACDSNSDCLFWSGRCPHWYCEGAVVSEEGRDEFDTAVAEIETRLCAPFAQEGCYEGLPMPGCFYPPEVLCVDGQCTNCRTGDCPETTCAQCETPVITWSSSFTTTTETYSVTDCTTFTHETALGGACSTTPRCIADRNLAQRDRSIGQLQNALGNPDVLAALAAQATFGAGSPAGDIFVIRVGGDEITLLGECQDAGPSCIDAPEGVYLLREMLEAIAMEQACEAMPAPACALPFDPGTGTDTITVFAFHAQAGTCVPQLYTGSGGNANRFDDLESCRDACPNTASEGGCPPNRTFVSEFCLECGPVGACIGYAPVCAKLCTAAEDCEGEPATCGSTGLCDARVCF
jgi:hypothetical protein